MTFVEMVRTILAETETKQGVFARRLGYSEQYLSDVLAGRRAPSLNLVNAICKRMGRGPKGRAEWHRAGARAHGWEV